MMKLVIENKYIACKIKRRATVTANRRCEKQETYLQRQIHSALQLGAESPSLFMLRQRRWSPINSLRKLHVVRFLIPRTIVIYARRIFIPAPDYTRKRGGLKFIIVLRFVTRRELNSGCSSRPLLQFQRNRDAV